MGADTQGTFASQEPHHETLLLLGMQLFITSCSFTVGQAPSAPTGTPKHMPGVVAEASNNVAKIRTSEETGEVRICGGALLHCEAPKTCCGHRDVEKPKLNHARSCTNV